MSLWATFLMSKSNTGNLRNYLYFWILVYTVTTSFMAVQWMYSNPQTDINWQQNMIMMIQGLNPLAFTFHPGGLPINLASLCLQLEKISCLEFRVAWLGFSKMLNFSLVHNLQMPFTGLNKGMFYSKNFHSTVGVPPLLLFFPKMGVQGNFSFCTFFC